MKICRLVVPLILIASSHVFSQTWSWNALGGPYGGTINDNINPAAGVTLVSTNNGVYRSSDSGTTWARMILGSDNIFTDLEIDPSSSGNKIYAATSNGARVYVSSDAGLTWTQLSTTGVLSVVTKIKVASSGTLIYMYDNNNRLLKSTNTGASFTNIPVGATVNDMDIDASNNLYLSTNGQGIKVTADGTTFNAASIGSLTGTSTVYSTVISGSTIFALAPDGPHKSTNAGVSYTSVKNNLTDVSFTGIIDTDASGNIYIANNSSHMIFTSTAASAGGTWSAGVAFPSPYSANTSYFQSTTTWFLGVTSWGVIKTTNTGGSWSQTSSGIKAISGSNKVFITPANNYLFMGWSIGTGYFLSTNNGTSWSLNNTGANVNRQLNGFIKLADNSILGYGAGVIRSTDELNWTLQSSQVITELVSSNGTNLFSYSSSNLLSSTNQGVTWTTQAMTGLTGTPTKIQVDASNNLYFKLSSEVDKVNSGTTTGAKLTALTATTIQDIQVVGSSLYVLGNGNTLYISTDGGLTFTAKVVPSGSTALWVYDSKNMFLRTTTNNFYYSTDGGGIWTSQPLLDSQASATDVAISPATFLYVATTNSVVHKSSKVVLPPSAPTSLAAIGTSYDQVQLIWNDNANNEDDHIIEISVGDNQQYSAQLQSPLLGSVTTTQNKINYTYTGLTKNTLYYFRVKAINNAASSAYSNEISVTTIDQCASTILNNRSWSAVSVPDAGSTATGPGPFVGANVNILAVTNTTNQFTISNYDFGADPNGSGSGSFIESCGQTVNLESGIYIGNGNGTWNGNTLVLHWQDNVDNNFYQGTTTFTLNPTDPTPAAPSLNTYLYSGTEVLLNWNSISFAEQYDIKRATVSGGPYTLVATVDYPKVIYVDKNLTTGNSYYYIITAKNTWGTSAASPEAGILLQNGLFRPVENSIQQNFENQQGVAWGDLDGDGDEDIASPSFINNAQQAVPPVFYENMGDGVNFTRRDLSVLTNENTDISRGINIFDYNNDGKLDLYINRSGNNTADLLLINNGSWSFTKQVVTETIPFNNAFRCSAAADYDNDGKADIFVGNFVSPTATRSQLLKNSGGTSYTEILTGSLVTDVMDAPNANWADYDNDGDQDIFIIDRNGSVQNRLYKNNGDGTFTRVTGLIFDTDIFGAARTSSWGDIDNDGDLDLYVGSQSASASNYDRLYQNNGNGTFTSLTSSVVAEVGTATYGSSFGDIDNDGDLDLIAINQAANSIFLNNGSGTFTKYAVQELFTNPGIFEIGGSMADFDQDGFLDIYPPKGNTSTVDLPNFLYKNAATASSSKKWIELKLIGVQSNVAAIGARVTVTTTSPARTQIREVSTRTGYGSSNSLIQHFGLGTATVASIQVKWPSGIIQTLSNVNANQVITITEDNIGPVASVLSPANGSANVNANTTLAITLNETPTAVASKFIKLFKTSDLVNAVASFDVTTGSVSSNTFIFTPPQNLLQSTSYSVSIDAGAFKDVYGNQSLSMNPSAWQFTTTAGPAVTLLNPLSNASGVAFNTQIEITFDRPITGVVGKKINVFIQGSGSPEFALDVSTGTISGNKISFTPPSPLITETIYDVKIDVGAFIDSNNNTTPAITWSFVTLDNVAPTIAFTSPAQAPSQLDYKFSSLQFALTISDNSGTISSATLSYRKLAGGAFTDLNGTSSGNVWNFTVQESFFDGNGLEFFITAKDPTNNVGRLPLDPNTNFFTYLNYKAADNAIPADKIGGGGTINGWKIFTIPFDLGSNNSVSTVLDELSTLTYKVDWRMLSYINATAWGEYPTDFQTFTRGKGYFINIKTPPTIKLPDAVAPTNTRKNLFQMSLKKGWNQIGNPYLTSISWDDVKNFTGNNLTGTGTQLKKFASGNYVNDNSLAPFEGGFVLAENDVTVSIPFAGQTALGGRQSKTNMGNEDWILPMVLKNGEVENNFGGVGMHVDASFSYDQFDDVNGPRFISYLDMNFAHPEHFAKEFARDVVPQQKGYTWGFVVSTNLNEISTFRWDASELIKKTDADIYLLDVTLQRPVNIRTTSEYRFDPQVSREFKIFFGNDVKEKLKPETITLGDAYPNPSNSKVTIPFTVPEGQTQYYVTLEVYDIMGKKMCTLVSQSLPSGFYTSQWEPGQETNSGLYIYRMNAVGNGNSSTLTKKIIVTH